VRRRLYIDWLRGIAVLLMILWHVVDAWTVRTGRDTTGFGVVTFAGGWAAPLFLFLAGVSVPLAGAARLTRGQDREAASRALQRRGWVVFGLAHVFRFQSFLLNPRGSWSSLLKPDILNILGLGLVVVAFAWRRSDGRRGVPIWMLLPALVIVVLLTPWARLWAWPSLLYPRFEAYIRPVGNYGVFSLFPSVAYILAGGAVGEWLSTQGDHALRWLSRWAVVAVLAGIGLTLALRPIPGHWLAPTAVFLWRTGAMVLLLTVARVLIARWSALGEGLVVLFGRTSLFVYWVHVELAYGVFSYPVHNTLTLGWSLAGCGLMVVLMAGLARLWARRRAGVPLIPAHMVAST